MLWVQGSNQALLAFRHAEFRCRYATNIAVITLRSSVCAYNTLNKERHAADTPEIILFFNPFENCGAAVSQQTRGADAMLAC